MIIFKNSASTELSSQEAEITKDQHYFATSNSREPNRQETRLPSNQVMFGAGRCTLLKKLRGQILYWALSLSWKTFQFNALSLFSISQVPKPI